MCLAPLPLLPSQCSIENFPSQKSSGSSSHFLLDLPPPSSPSYSIFSSSPCSFCLTSKASAPSLSFPFILVAERQLYPPLSILHLNAAVLVAQVPMLVSLFLATIKPLASAPLIFASYIDDPKYTHLPSLLPVHSISPSPSQPSPFEYPT